MPTTFPEVMAPIDALTVLARPDIKARMQTAVSKAVADVEQHIISSRSLYVPRQISERENGFRSWLEAFSAKSFDQWLDAYKHQLAQEIQSEFLTALPDVFAGLRNKELIRETVETLIWPEIQPILRKRAEDLLLTYAVRGITVLWVNRNLGDGLLLGVPETRNDGWCVPLYDRFSQQWAADVLLDRDGNVLVEANKLRTVLGLSQ